MTDSGRKRRISKRELRKRKIKMKKLFCIELLCIFSILSFLIGKNVGAAEEDKEQRISVSEKEETYGDEGVKQNIDIFGTDADAVVGNKLQENTSDGILLVNKDNKLPEDYKVTLKTLPDRTNKAAEEAYQPLCDMLSAGRKEGLAFEICSSYRSVERQQELFDEDLTKLIRAGYSYQEAYKEVAKETMPPGYSEHSTGLAFDIVSLGYQILDDRQEKTAENIWLQEHCAEYGFILRYPKGKEEITDISYESWHFRYVGVEAATYIMEKGITLEQYLEEA